MTVLRRIFRATETENRRVILDAMPRRPGARLLDLGCGDGAWTVEVARHLGAAEAHGVELIPTLVTLARDRGVNVLAADISAPIPDLENASFDVIHSNQVIEHLKNTDGFCSEIARLLRPGGYAVLSTNNLSSWHNILALVMGWQPLPCNVSDRINVGNPLNPYDEHEHAFEGQTHLRVFTGRGLSELARFHGLRAVDERAAGYYPFPPRVARHLARIDRRHGAFLVHRFELA